LALYFLFERNNKCGQPKPPSLVGIHKNIFFNCSEVEIIGEVFYEKHLSIIMHALDEIKIRIVAIDYVKFWFSFLIK
jgi:hypothetical protein